MKDIQLFEALKALEKRLEQHDNTDLGDTDIMLRTEATLDKPKEHERVRNNLIEEEYIEISGDKDDKNSSVTAVHLDKFRQERDIRKYDPREYFTRSVHGNEKFDAEKMAEEIMKNYRFLKIEGQENSLHLYRDGVWKNQQYAVETIERQVNERLGQETSSTYRSNVKNIIKNHRAVQIEEEKFKHPKMLIPFSNGVYDLKSEQFKDYKPEHYFTFKYDAEYRPELENDDVEKFIKDIAPEGEDKRKKLHEIAALSMAPWRVKEIMPILFGKGSNGKNQFVKVLKKILGKENYHISSSKKISEDKFESATMHDTQLLFLDEFENASSPSKLKRLTDSEQNIRGMHQEPGTIETSVQPIFAANEPPNPEEDSDGFFRRWQIINFNQKFTEEDDDNPDKLSSTELEEKYMSKEAIDSYATSLVTHLKDVIDKNKLTNQQKQSKVRAIWEEKASAVYHFIDNFLTQGTVNNRDGKHIGDYIIKKELTLLVNSYLDQKNLSKTDTSHITRALEKHPDIEVNSSARPEPKDGLDPKQPTAYEGVRIRDDSVHDIKGVLPLYAWRSPELKRLTNYRKYRDITNESKTAIALAFLKNHKGEGVNMVELIKELNLTYKELSSINSSDYIKKEQIEKNGDFIPLYKIDEEQLDEDLSDSDILIDKHGKNVTPRDWLRDEIETWSNQTVKDMSELIEKGKSTGFSEEAIETELQNLEDEGLICEPQPNRVQRL